MARASVFQTDDEGSTPSYRSLTKTKGKYFTMHESFAEATIAFGIRQTWSSRVWGFIESQYSSPTRFYHNMDHILEMVEVIGELRYACDDYHSVILAAWYHDLIYDTTRDDNESQSAFYALMSLEWLAGPKTWMPYHVFALVQATADHNPKTADEMVLCDADLLRFADPYDKFLKNNADIRREYGWVPQNEYDLGRAKVMQKFMDKEPLFHIPEINEQYEVIAKENIARLISG